MCGSHLSNADVMSRMFKLSAHRGYGTRHVLSTGKAALKETLLGYPASVGNLSLKPSRMRLRAEMHFG